MCRNKKTFIDLDESFHDAIKFGDNCTVSAMGKGRVTIQTKGNSTTLSLTFFLFARKGYKISIKDEVCQIQDAKLGLIAQVNMMTNCMLPLYLHNTTYSCFSAKLRDATWLWHFRMVT
ncbi:hypothetical protein ACOSQ3_028606 [Xanthoceras sorbifolium]